MNEKPSVEDILIGPNRPQKKKSKAPIIISLFLIIILLAGGVAAYYYYTNYMVEKPKSKFFRYLATNNIYQTFNSDVYSAIKEKCKTQTNNSNINLTASTNMESITNGQLDISKFNIGFNQVTDKNQNKNYSELNVNYADNELAKIKAIIDENSVAIASDEIADKYLGSSKENLDETLSRAFGIETNIEEVLQAINVENADNIEISEELKQTKSNEYMQIIYNAFKDESFSEKENVLISTDENQTLTANSYILNTTYSELNTLYSELLKNLRNDTELLGLISENTVQGNNNTQNQNTSINNNLENSIQSNAENNISLQNTTIDITPIREEDNGNTASNEENEEFQILTSILTGNKVNKTVQELQEILDEEITKIENSNVDNTEIEISLYVVEEKIRKLSVKSADINAEMEFLEETNKEKLKFTLLGVEVKNNNELATQDIEMESSNTVNQNVLEESTTDGASNLNNGFTIKIEKNTSDVSTKIFTELGLINNLEINTKISFDLTTNGTASSKEVKNEAIVTYTTQEGQATANINYNINFETATIEIPNLTDENCLFLDRLNDEELNNIMIQIIDRINFVTNEKKATLNLIDQNNNTSVVEQGNIQNQVNVQEKEAAKQKLIEVISNQMGEAELRGENYTLANLENLQIDGYNVTVNISGDIAVVTVNGYVFNIDSEFNLSEE